jgi:hypothetical protein
MQPSRGGCAEARTATGHDKDFSIDQHLRLLPYRIVSFVHVSFSRARSKGKNMQHVKVLQRP